MPRCRSTRVLSRQRRCSAPGARARKKRLVQLARGGRRGDRAGAAIASHGRTAGAVTSAALGGEGAAGPGVRRYKHAKSWRGVRGGRGEGRWRRRRYRRRRSDFGLRGARARGSVRRRWLTSGVRACARSSRTAPAASRPRSRPEPALSSSFFSLLGGDAVLLRRAVRGLEREVDDGDEAARRQGVAQLGAIRFRPAMWCQVSTIRMRSTLRRRRASDRRIRPSRRGRWLSDSRCARSLSVPDHVVLDVERQHAAGGADGARPGSGSK